MIEPERNEGRARAPRAAAGFTLLELLTVIAIIALLSTIIIGVGRRATESGRAARAKAELAALSAALDTYKRTYGDYPQTDDEARLLQSLVGKKNPLGNDITGRVILETARFTIARPATPAVSADPLTDPAAVLLDPWGQPYVYIYKAPVAGWMNPAYVLYSLGPDAKDAPTLLAGGYPDATPPDNADNIYANRY